MRVLATGSRDWTGVYAADYIHDILDAVHNMAQALGRNLIIVHGDGPGADQLIDAWALRRQDAGVTVDRTISAPIDFAVVFVRDGTGVPFLVQGAGVPTYTVHWTKEIE